MTYVNVNRIQEDIDRLAGISSTPMERGITRVSWTKEYARGTDYIKQQMLDAGLQVWEDKIGNICGLLKGSGAQTTEGDETGCIVCGSHLDTVLDAGAYDGIQGVVSALETARVFKEQQIPLRHDFIVLATVEEEGTRTGNVLTGSTYIRNCVEANCFGQEDRVPALPEITARDGKWLKDIVEEYKSWQQIKVPERPAFSQGVPKAFIELHDEQGPVLEQEEKEIGIVENIRGIINFEVTLTGASGHPGTVPLSVRKDCALAAYRVCLAASDFVLQNYDKDATITFGKMEVRPGSSNSIPGEVVFSVDIRFGMQEIGDRIEAEVRRLIDEEANAFGFAINYNMNVRKTPVPMDGKLQETIAAAAEKQGISVRRMDSGAGHDAMVIAGICPTAMIFAPCKDGVSHNAAEFVSRKDLQNAAEVLFETIIQLDKEI